MAKAAGDGPAIPPYVFEDARRLAGEVEMLRRLGAMLNHLDVSETEIFSEMVAVVRSYLKADKFLLLLDDPDSESLAQVDGDALGVQGREAPMVRTMDLPEGVRAVITDRRSLLVENRNELEPEDPLTLYLRGLDMKSMVSVPLVAGMNTIGSISLASRNSLAYRTGELKTVELLGMMFGSVVENVRLFQQVSSARREVIGIIDQFEEPIFVVDENRIVVRLNHALKECLGGDYNDILNRPAADVLEQVSPALRDLDLDSVFETGEKLSTRVAEDALVEIEVRASVLEWRGGRPHKVVVRAFERL